MKEKGVKLTPNTSVININGHEVQIMDNYSGAVASRYGIDNVLIAAPAVPDNQLYYQLKPQVKNSLDWRRIKPPVYLENAIYGRFLMQAVSI